MAPTIPKLTDEQLSDIIDHYDELDNEKKAVSEAIKLLTLMAMDEKEVLRADYEAAVSVIYRNAFSGKSMSEDLQKLKLLMLGQLNEKAASRSNKAATISRTPHESYTTEDVTMLKEYSEESGDWGWVSATVTKAWCAEYENQHGRLPPGVEKFSEWRLKFSRKRKKV